MCPFYLTFMALLGDISVFQPRKLRLHGLSNSSKATSTRVQTGLILLPKHALPLGSKGREASTPPQKNKELPSPPPHPSTSPWGCPEAIWGRACSAPTGLPPGLPSSPSAEPPAHTWAPQGHWLQCPRSRPQTGVHLWQMWLQGSSGEAAVPPHGCASGLSGWRMPGGPSLTSAC